ncbi:MAG TPA: cytidine deaminase [Porphyromonadaceae bacterium]|nr:cytidine deaminase [Paramuribaculum sp.]HAB41060.1 cytidine deaminase [Porphyromonadaceae bacterium]
MRHETIKLELAAADYDELSERERLLVDTARAAVEGSYAPYSNFHVGAAVLLDNGEIVKGANQENAATPSSLCAERTAAYWAHANFPAARFEAIAIAARDASGREVETPISPCGACRQALLQYETLAAHDVKVILAGSREIYIAPSVKSLLPLAFTEF